jgi:hypothetical protein
MKYLFNLYHKVKKSIEQIMVMASRMYCKIQSGNNQMMKVKIKFQNPMSRASM